MSVGRSATAIEQRAAAIQAVQTDALRADAIRQAEQEAADAYAAGEPERKRLAKLADEALEVKVRDDAALNRAILAVMKAANVQRISARAAQSANTSAVGSGGYDSSRYVAFTLPETPDMRAAGMRNQTFVAGESGGLVELSIANELYSCLPPVLPPDGLSLGEQLRASNLSQGDKAMRLLLQGKDDPKRPLIADADPEPQSEEE